MVQVLQFPPQPLPANQLWELAQNMRAVLMCGEVIDRVILDRQIMDLKHSNYIIPQSLRG